MVLGVGLIELDFSFLACFVLQRQRILQSSEFSCLSAWWENIGMLNSGKRSK
uniref:Uncharacterized protein n=1 Tax=Rhizophora mucronata TaxID=61149 RepID=A0A2P2NMZ2_RHIMU